MAFADMGLREDARAESGANGGGSAASVLAHLGIAEPPVLRGSSLHAPITMLRLQSAAAEREDYADLPREDAWIFRLHLQELSDHSLWLDGKRMPVARCSPGSVSVYDVQSELAVSIIDPLDVVRIFVPRAALDQLAKELGAPRIRRIDVAHGAATHDPAIYALISSLLPALMAPEAVFGLFVDHVLLAVLAHIGRTYGGMDVAQAASRGKLAPWQERRAKEVLEAESNSGLRLAMAADACGLSASHFARAFKQSTGQPPHRWLLHRRVDRAKQFMSDTHATLAETALACGFADQSHFNRVFEQIVGVPPGTWRRRSGGKALSCDGAFMAERCSTSTGRL